MPTLDGLNIGGGFPIKNSLTFEYDYQYMIDEIINQIKIACEEAERIFNKEKNEMVEKEESKSVEKVKSKFNINEYKKIIK